MLVTFAVNSLLTCIWPNRFGPHLPGPLKPLKSAYRLKIVEELLVLSVGEEVGADTASLATTLLVCALAVGCSIAYVSVPAIAAMVTTASNDSALVFVLIP